MSKMVFFSFVIFLTSCQRKSIKDVWIYEKSSYPISLQDTSRFSRFCNEVSQEVITLKDNNGQFLVDTISGLSALNSLNCQINTDNIKKYYDHIFLDNGHYNIDLLKSSYLYTSVVSEFENTDNINYVLKNKFKLKSLPSDSFQLENLINLILNSQFGSHTSDRYDIFISSRSDWRILQNKYSNTTFDQVFSIRKINYLEELEYKEISSLISKNNSNDWQNVYFCFANKNYNINYQARFNDLLIKYHFFVSETGHVQVEKQIASLYYIIFPGSYE